MSSWSPRLQMAERDRVINGLSDPQEANVPNRKKWTVFSIANSYKIPSLSSKVTGIDLLLLNPAWPGILDPDEMH